MRLDVFHALRDLKADEIGAFVSLVHPACQPTLICPARIGWGGYLSERGRPFSAHNQVQTSDQPQGRQGTGPHCAVPRFSPVRHLGGICRSTRYHRACLAREKLAAARAVCETASFSSAKGSAKSSLYLFAGSPPRSRWSRRRGRDPEIHWRLVGSTPHQRHTKSAPARLQLLSARMVPARARCCAPFPVSNQ
jgi:hypothetical protein